MKKLLSGALFGWIDASVVVVNCCMLVGRYVACSRVRNMSSVIMRLDWLIEGAVLWCVQVRRRRRRGELDIQTIRAIKTSNFSVQKIVQELFIYHCHGFSLVLLCVRCLEEI